MTLAWIRELAPVIIHVNLPTIAENLASLGENGVGCGKVADEAIECNRYKHTSVWNIMIKYMIYDHV